jgi:hypothetical protein
MQTNIFTTCYGWSGLFVSECESSVIAATSVVWGRQPRANVNRAQRKSGECDTEREMVPNNNRCVHLAAVTKSCWHGPNTHVNVYTLKVKTKTNTETEWIMSTPQSRDSSYCHTSLTSLYSLISLGYLRLPRNEKQVWWMKCQQGFGALCAETELNTGQRSKWNITIP